MIADQADIGVSKQLEIDEIEACGMHDGDKIGKADTGKLMRSKNKRVANPFPS